MKTNSLDIIQLKLPVIRKEIQRVNNNSIDRAISISFILTLKKCSFLMTIYNTVITIILLNIFT